MSEYIFGAHILESLTTGMYQDSRMIFREYIQNACDSIDKAVKSGLIAQDEARIDINIDYQSRNITITDNGTGIKSCDFMRVLGNIADSDKKAGQDKGFRGIGRLCGLAYCEKLIFTAKFQGEKVISKLICDAKIMRELISSNLREKRLTALEVLEKINSFTTEKTKDIDSHYFSVEIIGINSENTDLLNCANVKDYLAFTAPLPYSFTFSKYRSAIYEHAEKLGFTIDEYNIFLNDEQLFKPYTPFFETSKGSDEIFDLEFQDIRDEKGGLLAWLWFGISCFIAKIDRHCPMWGIRLRRENIQIGNEYTMQKFFADEGGNRYFIGELFCVSRDLIPNAQRDYFNENKARSDFEEKVSDYCETLSTIYKKGSEINSCFKRIIQAESRIAEINYRITKDYFSDDEKKERALENLKKAEEEAVKEKNKLEKIASCNEITQKVAERVKEVRSLHSIGRGSINRSSKYTQNEKKLLNRVFGIISENLGNLADPLIEQIQRGLGLK